MPAATRPTGLTVVTATAPRRVRPAVLKALAVLLSVAIAIGVGEALLRYALFATPYALGAKEPSWYARTPDELWTYRYLFSAHRQWALGSQPSATGLLGEASPDTRIRFYQHWATSLMPDAELGYVRKPDVRVPCHETTALGTRGVRPVVERRPKILFFGDSYVESAACSDDTITTKLEALTGVDTLNYGVGGYGLDQIALYYERVVPRFDRDDTLVLIGLIQDDLERTLLKVRTSPKPYFTLRGDALELHTDHIHPATLNDAFVRPLRYFYLFDFLRGRLGFAAYPAAMKATRDERRAQVRTMAAHLVDRFADRARQGHFRLAFVVLPSPGVRFDETVLAAIRARGLPVMDLQRCLQDSGRPDADLYEELHPTSLGNDLLAACLVAQLPAALAAK